MARQICRIGFAGEACELLAERALWWERERTLFVADVHLGKSAAFRAAGIGIPEVIDDDLARLSSLLQSRDAARLIVLGDLFHAPEGQSPAVRGALVAWRERHRDTEVRVARGNHDRGCERLFAQLDFAVADYIQLGSFAGVHAVESADDCEAFTLCGHIHPAVRLHDTTRSFCLPCFWFTQRCGVLPAFGGFTGTHVIERCPSHRVFAVAEGRVVEV